MTGGRDVVVVPDADLLAAHVAGRLITTLTTAQADRGTASVVLTGGGIGTATLRALAADRSRQTVDWSRVDFWWGDERFVPSDDEERNDRGAYRALLEHLPVDPARVHAIASSGDVATAEDAAVAYAHDLAHAAARELGRAGNSGGAGVSGVVVPAFDVVLLGIGPEGHVASVFPASAALDDGGRSVVAVHGCSKPPPTRVTLTLPSINTASEVWILASTADKAPAIAAALSGANPIDVPAAGVHGRVRTVFLVDRAAAAGLPSTYLLA